MWVNMTISLSKALSSLLDYH